jgi:putative flippase GtrA
VKKIFADKNLIMFVKFSVVGATNTVLDAVVFF